MYTYIVIQTKRIFKVSTVSSIEYMAPVTYEYNMLKKMCIKVYFLLPGIIRMNAVTRFASTPARVRVNAIYLALFIIDCQTIALLDYKAKAKVLLYD